MIRFSFFFFLFFVWGCRNSSTEEKGTYKVDWEKAEKIKNEFAQGFSIEKSGKYFRITITDPQTGNEYGKYVLYPKKSEKPELNEGEISISYPVKTFASVSTTHLPFLKLTGEARSLKGFAGHRFVLDSFFINLFKEEKTAELGSDNNLDYEKLIELFPEVLMVYPFGSLNFDKISAAKIPVFYNTEYLELHPLGKAEWLKVFGILFDRQKEVEIHFSLICHRYKRILIDFVKSRDYYRPTVFTGLNFSGTWYVPGGKSFQAQLLKEAQVNYIWQDDLNNNSLTLSEETVIDKCLNAEFWVIVSSEKDNFSYEDLMNQNSKYKYFKAAKNKNIIFCNSNEKDFFGMAIVEPDVILSDLIYFFHPGFFKNYTPKYFERLQ